MDLLAPLLLPVAAAVAAVVITSLRVLREYERGVVFRLGRLTRPRGPGLVFLVPLGVERMVKVPLRIVTMDIPPQDVITRDNISVKVNAVVYFRVRDPVKATVEIQDYLYATSQLAQTTLRNVVGQAELDQLLSDREHINHIVQKIIDEGTDPWGIDVVSVEMKDIDLPQEMKRAMARQAEAERERRAKIIAAEGEYQASAKLAEAARIIGKYPSAIQLRYLQTVTEIATENNSTTLFPIPIDMFQPFLKKLTGQAPSVDEAKVEAEIARAEEEADRALARGAPEGELLMPPQVPAGASAGAKLDPEPVRSEKESS